jgi:dienelactone hydrolase
VARLGGRELFQWAGRDIFVSAAIRERFADHAPQAQVILYPTADHQFTTAAQADRDSFLVKQLGLAG